MNIPVIERIDVTPFQIPFATFLRSGRHHYLKMAENVLVRVTADDGMVGLAEANAFQELLEESQASIVHAISDWIAPRVKVIAVRVGGRCAVIVPEGVLFGNIDVALQ